MAGFNKIVPEIIQSSIWNEPSDIRVVWITMLATKDKDGYVRGDAKTIARMANVSIESAEAALKRFQEPDPSSHTPDYEGRRIYHAPGGWMVINSDLYREIGMNETQREAWRIDKQKQRAKKKENVQDMSKTLPRKSTETHVSVSVSDNVICIDEGVQGKREEKTEPDKEQEEFNSLFEGLSIQPCFVQEWQEWMKARKKGSKTTHAKVLLLRTLSEHPEKAVEALKEAITRGWTGFKWEWVEKKQSTFQQKPVHQQTATFISTGDEYLKSKGLIK